MKIILLEDVKKQGKKGDILTVKDGYGNFLINNHQAVLATQGGVERLNKEVAEKAHNEKLLIEKCTKIKNKLEKEKISFKVKTGEQGRVFGSISTKQIADFLQSKGYEIDKKQITTDGSLSSLGFHTVKVELHKSVIANIKVELVS